MSARRVKYDPDKYAGQDMSDVKWWDGVSGHEAEDGTFVPDRWSFTEDVASDRRNAGKWC